MGEKEGGRKRTSKADFLFSPHSTPGDYREKGVGGVRD